MRSLERLYGRQRYRVRKAAGLCRGGRTTCDACYARNRARNARHRARKAVRR